MATRITNIETFLNSDATFRAWCQAVHDALAACGLVQTADTGQINLATVAKPTAINTVAGYEIWRFADPLQATKPVIFKIEYGTGASVNGAILFITVGTASNGVGALTGLSVSTRTQVNMVNPTASAITNMYFSGDGTKGYFFALLNNDSLASNNKSGFFGIERTKDMTGANTGDGAFLVAGGANANAGACQLIRLDGASPPSGGLLSNHCLRSGQSQFSGLPNVGNNLGLSPIFLLLGVWLYSWLLSYRNSDLTSFITFQMNHLGAQHTFMPLGPGSGSAALGAQSDVLAIPWE